MRLERIADRIEYCFKYGKDCLNDREWKFVCDMKQWSDKRGDLLYLSPKQHVFIGSCFGKVIKAHPVENESTLDRMKRKLAELRSRTNVTARAKRKRDLITPQSNKSITTHQFHKQFEEEEVTVKSKPHGSRATRLYQRQVTRTLIRQKPRVKGER